MAEYRDALIRRDVSRRAVVDGLQRQSYLSQARRNEKGSLCRLQTSMRTGGPTMRIGGRGVQG